VPFVSHTSEVGLTGTVSDSVTRDGLAQQTKEVWEAVYALPESYREVVLMFYLSGLSYREIAGTLGTSTSTVSSRLRESRRRLREHLTDRELEDWTMDDFVDLGPFARGPRIVRPAASGVGLCNESAGLLQYLLDRAA